MIDDYSEDYCQFLEATYGTNMLSEGGHEAIDRMFQGINGSPRLKGATLSA